MEGEVELVIWRLMVGVRGMLAVGVLDEGVVMGGRTEKEEGSQTNR